MAARRNGVFVPTRERAEERPYTIHGFGSGGREVNFTVQATDSYDALAIAKTRVALTSMTAKEA